MAAASDLAAIQRRETAKGSTSYGAGVSNNTSHSGAPLNRYLRFLFLLFLPPALSSCAASGAYSTNAGTDMVRLGPASFSMGSDENEIDRLMTRYPNLPRDVFASESPRHVVQLPAYTIDRYEVTNEQYREFLRANPSSLPAALPAPKSNGSYLKGWTASTYPAGEGHRPVTYITWYSANAYFAWRGGRLPTEAEWEYAASGGLDRPEFPWGDSPPTATSANWSGASIDHPTESENFCQTATDSTTWPATSGSTPPIGGRTIRRNRNPMRATQFGAEATVPAS